MIQHYNPRSLSPARLDKYLASGWFRSTNILYRSQILCLDGGIFAPVNIRLKLPEYTFSKSLRKIYSKNNKHFSYQIKPINANDLINQEKNELYKNHCKRFKGFIFDNLSQFFYNNSIKSVFDTYEVAVYDESKLIGLSYFDLGQKSVASLLSVYDVTDEYKKYSLGVYTMLLEVVYAQEQDKTYYYPGYVLDKPSDFDYKLRLKDYYYYDWRGTWKKPFEKYKQENWLVHDLRNKYEQIETYLIEHNIAFDKLYYPYYALAYSVENYFNNFVKGMLLFILDYDEEGSPEYIIEFDVEENIFYYYKIELLYAYDDMIGMNFSDDFKDKSIYTLDIFGYSELISEASEVVDLFERESFIEKNR